ncbi:S-adenosyl-L-methionine-dependent methyltransferase [Phlyctochytrium arcticum]|nr:S-adenosyl-L-methionine-dependent methyltransferase [Phlyctochytrium arcticum]
MPALSDFPAEVQALAEYLQNQITPTSALNDFKPLLSAVITTSQLHDRLPPSASTFLHLAARAGNIEAATEILRAGIPWNVVDADGKSVGQVAREADHEQMYNVLVEEGVRTEFLLMALGKQGNNYGENDTEKAEFGSNENGEDAKGGSAAESTPSNIAYLSQPLTFSQGLILDSESNAVMMGWEHPLMKLHAERLAPHPGLTVLNVGFGLGIIDTELQLRSPAHHVIVEAHPDVYAQMERDGWTKKENVTVVFGRWQDVIEEVLLLGPYDGVYFDTFGEYYDDLKAFHEHVPNMLRDETSQYSFFNGLAGTNPFFHDVSCQLAERDLMDMGMGVKWEEIEMDPLGDETWKGVRRAYFSLPIYRLPTVMFDL